MPNYDDLLAGVGESGNEGVGYDDLLAGVGDGATPEPQYNPEATSAALRLRELESSPESTDNLTEQIRRSNIDLARKDFEKKAGLLTQAAQSALPESSYTDIFRANNNSFVDRRLLGATGSVESALSWLDSATSLQDDEDQGRAIRLHKEAIVADPAIRTPEQKDFLSAIYGRADIKADDKDFDFGALDNFISRMEYTRQSRAGGILSTLRDKQAGYQQAIDAERKNINTDGNFLKSVVDSAQSSAQDMVFDIATGRVVRAGAGEKLAAARGAGAAGDAASAAIRAKAMADATSVGALSSMAVQVYGQTRAEGIAEGLSPAEAEARARWFTATEYATELLPLDIILKGKVDEGVIKKALKASGAEGLSEIIATGLQSGYDHLNVEGKEITLGELLEQMAHAGATGALVGGSVSVLADATRTSVKQPGKAESAEDVMREIGDRYKASPATKPEGYSAIDAEMSAAGTKISAALDALPADAAEPVKYRTVREIMIEHGVTPAKAPRTMVERIVAAHRNKKPANVSGQAEGDVTDIGAELRKMAGLDETTVDAPVEKPKPVRFAVDDSVEPKRAGNDSAEIEYLQRAAADLDEMGRIDRKEFNADIHSLSDAIAFAGGLDRAHLGGEVDIKTANTSRTGKPVVRVAGSGLTPDHMAERLNELGFRTPGGENLDPNNLMEMLADEAVGKKHYSTSKAYTGKFDEDRGFANLFAGGDSTKLAGAIRKYLAGGDLGINQRRALKAIIEVAYETGELAGRDPGAPEARDDARPIADALVGAGFGADDTAALAAAREAYEAGVPVQDIAEAIRAAGGDPASLDVSEEQMAGEVRLTPEDRATDSAGGQTAVIAQAASRLSRALADVARTRKGRAMRAADAVTPKRNTGNFRQPYDNEIESAIGKAGTAAWKANVSPEQAAAMFDALFPRAHIDPTTGFYKNDQRAETMVRSFEYLKTADVDGFYIEIDLANLNGRNKALGHSGADKSYRATARIISSALTNKFRKDVAFDQVNFRHGGDEMSFFVFGKDINLSSIEEVLRRAQETTWKYDRSLGLHEIEHAKHKGDETKIGGGFYFGVAKIDPEKTIDENFSAADKLVERQKEEPSYGYRKREEARAARPDADGKGSQDEGAGRGERDVPPGIGSEQQGAPGEPAGAGRDGDAEVRLEAGQAGRDPALDEGLTLEQESAPADVLRTVSAGHETWELATADGTFAGTDTLALDAAGNIVLTRHADTEEGLLKNNQQVSREELRSVAENGGAFGAGTVNTSAQSTWATRDWAAAGQGGVAGTFRIPPAKLREMLDNGDAALADVSLGEIIFRPGVLDQYLTELNGKPVAPATPAAATDLFGKTDQEVAQQSVADVIAEKEAKRKRDAERAAKMSDGPLYDGTAEQADALTGKKEEPAKPDETEASTILDAADVRGKDRLEAMEKFRAGTYTLDDLKGAYPPKAAVKPAPAAEKKAAKVTPQIASERQLNSMIAIAADSIGELRSVDVDRVLSEAPVHFRLSLAQHIKSKRKDLAGAVDSAMEDIASEGGASASAQEQKPPAEQAGNIEEIISDLSLAKENLDKADRERSWERDADKYWETAQKVGEERARLVDAISKIDDAGFGMEGKTSDGRALMLTPSASEPGRWQVTRMAKDGSPWGDTRYDSKQQAAKDMLAEVDPKSIVVFGERSVAARTEAPSSKSVPGVIDDFGEKLGGARKDKAAAQREAMERELSDEDIATLPLSKIWPKGEVDDIEDTYIAAVAHAARQEIPAKPRQSYKVRVWVQKVRAVRNLAQWVLGGTYTKEAFAEKMRGFNSGSLEHFADKVALLEMLDRKHWDRIGKVAVYPNAQRRVDGKDVTVPTVSVEVDDQRYYMGANGLADAVDAIREKLGDGATEKQMKFEVRGSNDQWRINKVGDPLYRPLKSFTDSKEALAYVRNNNAELVAAWEALKERQNVKQSDVRRDTNRQRTAQNWRDGKDVTPQQFIDEFGFRGVEFGNWVGQGKSAKERQGMLNEAYDALKDLSDITGIPPKAISLSGSLGLGFGSRGHGWASAHFEPGTLVINLTKTRGAGALAHEWFHALDNHFQLKRGAPANNEAHNHFITYAPENYYVHKVSGLKLPEKAFEVMIDGESHPRFGKMSARARDRSQWEFKAGVRTEVAERFAELVNALNASPMAKRSRLIDKGKSDGYWSSIIEMGARSFENYVIHKMMLKGYHNDYLANVTAIDEFQRDTERYPYLLAGEVAPVAEAFDALFATVKTRNEADGRVSIYEPAKGYNGNAVHAKRMEVESGKASNLQRRRVSAATEQGDLFTASAIPAGEQRATAAADIYHVTVEHEEVGRIDVGHEVIDSPEKAAWALRHLGRRAQEQMVALVTDKDGKPISLISHTSGVKNASQVDVGGLAGAIVAQPGAHNVWLAHNHPGGDSTPSPADRSVTNKVADIISGSGVAIRGHVVVGNNEAWHFTDRNGGGTGDWYGSPIGSQKAPAGKEISVVERFIKTRGDGGQINGPDDAVRIAGGLKGSGVMLLDNRRRVVGFVPMTSEDMVSLRNSSDPAASTPLYRLLVAMDKTNAGSMIVVGGNKDAADNVSKFGNAIDPPAHGEEPAVVDWIVGGKSMRASGKWGPQTEDAFFSLSKPSVAAAGGVSADLVRSEIESLKKAIPGLDTVVVQSVNELPAYIVDYIDRRESRGDLDSAKIEGVFDPVAGRCYVVADNLTSAKRGAEVALHENVAHFGTRVLLGDRHEAVMLEIERSFRGRPDFEEVRARYGLKNNLSRKERAQAADEFVARLSESGTLAAMAKSKPLGPVGRLFRAIREILQRAGLVDWNDADIERLLARAVDAVNGQRAAEAGERDLQLSIARNWYYSPLSRAVDAAKQEKASAAQWKALLQKSSGVKAEELEWSGVLDWLDGKTGSVTKADVADFVRAGGVDLQEVMKGGEPFNPLAGVTAVRWSDVPESDRASGAFLGMDAIEDDDWVFMQDGAPLLAPSVPFDDADTAEQAMEQLVSYQDPDVANDMARGDQPKYGRYQLPGGKNYREMLLTLPVKEMDNPKMDAFLSFEKSLKEKYGNAFDSKATMAEKIRLSDLRRDATGGGVLTNATKGDAANFTSSHWQEPNVLAHIRFNERAGANGERVLHIEEIQSDWHQAGRKHGYKKLSREEAARKALLDAKPMREWGADDIDWYNRRVNDAQRDGVPDAPFKDTGAWSLLAMKRMIAYASQNGFDAITWTGGEAQAERYDLSKHIDDLEVTRNDEGARFTVVARTYGDVVFKEELSSLTNLDQYVGKELAEKIKDDFAEKPGNKHSYSGLDLKVGGKGMIAFYDKILPEKVGGFIKKFGGKVEQFAVESPRKGSADYRIKAASPFNLGGPFIVVNERDEDHPAIGNREFATLREAQDALAQSGAATASFTGFRLTPKLREAAEAGLPLFSLSGSSQQNTNTAKAGQEARSNKGEWDALYEDVKSTQAVPESASLIDRVREAYAHLNKRNMLAFRQGFFDSFASIGALETSANGTLLDAGESAYKAALMTKNLSGVMAATLHHKQVRFDGKWFAVDESSEGFASIFEPLSKEPGLLRMWEHWAGAVRAKRLLREGREQNYTQEQVDRVLAFVEARPELSALFNEAHRGWRAFNKRTLDMAEAAGVVDPAERKLWENDDYVPFHRVIEEQEDAVAGKPLNRRGLEGQSSGIRRLKGSDAKVNILESMVMNTMHLIDASMKNVAMQRVTDLADGIAMEKIDLGWKPVEFTDAQLAGALKKHGVDVEKLTKEQREAWSTLFTRVRPQGADVVSVMRDGKREWYRVTDPLLMRAITAMGPEPFKAWLEVLGMPKQWLTTMVTADPGFMLANFMRDTLSTWAVVKPTGLPSEYRKHVMVDAIRGGTRSMLNSKDQWALMAAGATGEGYYRTMPADVRDQLDELHGLNNTLSTPMKMWRLWQHIGRSFENANRLAVHENVKKAGGSDAEAAYQAMDVLNFSRRGDWEAVRILMAVVPFLNARIQGLDRLYRGAKENPVSFAMKGAALTAATMLLMAVNDDDDRYWSLPEWDRDTYWHFWIGREHFRIPKPFEVGALFATVPERAWAYAKGKDNGGDVQEAAKRMLVGTFAINPIPQAFLPAYDVARNESTFRQSPIMPAYMADFYAPEDQYDPYTSETMRLVADVMPDAAPDALRSPKSLEYLLKGYFGTLGAHALNAADMLTREASDMAPAPTMTPSQYPLVGRFWRKGDTQTKYPEEFYEMLGEAEQLHARIKKLGDEGRKDAAREAKDGGRFSESDRKALQTAQKEMAAWNKEIKEIYASESMHPDTKRQKIAVLQEKRNNKARAMVEKLGQ